MRKLFIVMICGVLLIDLTGCAGLREAVQSKGNQGMVLGGLLGAGALTLAMVAGKQDKGVRGLGKWAAGGALIGGLAGWYLEHQLESKSQVSTP